MIVEIGHFALILATCVAFLQAVLPLAGTMLDRPRWQALAKPTALLQFALIVLAYAVLTHGAVTDDFSIKYIAGHSNSLLPMEFKVSAVWGGHEGSLLLWVLMLSGWTVAVALFSKTLPLAMVARVIGVLGWVSVGFLSFTVITSSPFERLIPAPADGRDLNPLLQDPGLIIHPPMLYMGYVGFSVAFAVAIAAYYIPRNKLNVEDIVIIGVTAAAIFAILDIYSPSTGEAVRFGAGFGIGANQVGFKPF